MAVQTTLNAMQYSGILFSVALSSHDDGLLGTRGSRGPPLGALA